MSAVNCLLKDLQIKRCTDTWQPWSNKNHVQGDKKDLRHTGFDSKGSSKLDDKRGWGTKGEWRSRENVKEAIKKLPPRVQVDGDDTEMNFDEDERERKKR